MAQGDKVIKKNTLVPSKNKRKHTADPKKGGI